MGYALVGVALAVAGVDWWAVARRARRVEYLVKPLTMVLLMAAAAVLPGDVSAARRGLTLLALGLSLAGDVFLMLPSDRFLAGLASFFAAHVAYVAAFSTTAPPAAPFALVLAALLAVGAVIYRALLRGMRRSGDSGMAVPVAVYTLALAATGASALATLARPDWDVPNALAAAVGGALFMASDSLIGWTRFVGDVPGGDVAIASTYHVGQALLVLGLLG